MHSLRWVALAFVTMDLACSSDVFRPLDAGTDAGATPAEASTAFLACGPNACATAEVCCVYESTIARYECHASCPAPKSGEQLSTLACLGAADCPPSGVCCVERKNGVNTSTCTASCNTNQAQLCDPKASTSRCPPNEPCSSWNISDWGLPASFGTCGGVAVP